MGSFGSFYSQYYDLLYSDKRYDREADYIAGLLQSYHPRAREILELGCGTGRHANELVKKGFRLHCIDSSEDMIAMAESNFGQSDRL